jgi:hypothetical protein
MLLIKSLSADFIAQLINRQVIGFIESAAARGQFCTKIGAHFATFFLRMSPSQPKPQTISVML